MLYFYIVASAAAVPILNNFFDILCHGYSWWLVPLTFIGLFICFIILHLSVAAISIFCVNLDSKPDRFCGYYRRVINSIVQLLFPLLGVKVETSGLDMVPENGRFLLVCNHIHDIDPAVIFKCLPNGELAFIGKKEIYTSLKFVAKAMHSIYGLPIDRENDRAAARTILQAAKLIKDDKASVAIFPEGYTGFSGELQPFRNGAFKIAYKADAPIVVCTVWGCRHAVKRLFRHRSTIYFDVLKTIHPDEFKDLHTNDLGASIHEEMERNLCIRREQLRNKQK